jgi:rod shape-determining protein MreD
MLALILFNLAAQSALFTRLAVWGAAPDTGVVLIVCYALLRGDLEGAAFGFFTGLSRDFFFGDIIGQQALLGFFLGYLAGKPFKDFFRDNNFLPVLLAGGGLLFYETGFYLLTYLFVGETDFLFYLRRIILPETAYSLVVTVPLYRGLAFLNKKLEKREKRLRKLF